MNEGTAHEYRIVRLQNLRADEEFAFPPEDLERIARNEHVRYCSEPERRFLRRKLEKCEPDRLL